MRSVTGLDRCNECDEIGRQNRKAPVSWLILSVRGLVALFLGVSVLIASWGKTGWRRSSASTSSSLEHRRCGMPGRHPPGAGCEFGESQELGIVAIVFAVLVITRETLAGWRWPQ